MSAQPLDIRLEEGERLRRLGIDEEICADIDAVLTGDPLNGGHPFALDHVFPDVARDARDRFAAQPRVLGWIDVTCGEHFHYFQRTDKGLEAFHSDNKPCTQSEYSLPLNV